MTLKSYRDDLISLIRAVSINKVTQSIASLTISFTWKGSVSEKKVIGKPRERNVADGVNRYSHICHRESSSARLVDY